MRENSIREVRTSNEIRNSKFDGTADEATGGGLPRGGQNDHLVLDLCGRRPAHSAQAAIFRWTN
jgi:hypothetical protein